MLNALWLDTRSTEASKLRRSLGSTCLCILRATDRDGGRADLEHSAESRSPSRTAARSRPREMMLSVPVAHRRGAVWQYAAELLNEAAAARDTVPNAEAQ
jgi:hypothetical protein